MATFVMAQLRLSVRHHLASMSWAQTLDSILLWRQLPDGCAPLYMGRNAEIARESARNDGRKVDLDKVRLFLAPASLQPCKGEAWGEGGGSEGSTKLLYLPHITGQLYYRYQS